MNTKRVTQEQLQEDILCLLEGMGIGKYMDEHDWEKLQDEVCDIIVTNFKNIED